MKQVGQKFERYFETESSTRNGYMIDLHCHILPNLDDGARSLDEALEMAHMAVEDGIEGIVCTPHWLPGIYENDRERILTKLRIFEQKLADNCIPLRLYPGSELRIDPRLADLLKSKQVLTLNDTGRYALIELPQMHIPERVDEFLWHLAVSGLTPILGHPERNLFLHQHVNRFYRWAEAGVLIQITAASLEGGFGEIVRDFAIFLLKHNLVHIIATDAHDLRFRSPNLSQAFRIAARLVGDEMAEKLVNKNPHRVVNAEPIVMEKPRHIRSSGSIWSYLRRFF